MAFASTIEERFPVGGGRYMSIGTYTSNGGTTGGDIITGNGRYTEYFGLMPYATAVTLNFSAIKETYDDPKLPTTITIVTDANQVGRWMAIGI